MGDMSKHSSVRQGLLSRDSETQGSLFFRTAAHLPVDVCIMGSIVGRELIEAPLQSHGRGEVLMGGASRLINCMKSYLLRTIYNIII